MSIGAIAGVAARINGLDSRRLMVIRAPVGDMPNGLPHGGSRWWVDLGLSVHIGTQL
jgi:hypothetical protein